jgi:hypothetical protein
MEHDVANLLPWYVNGTLSGQERSLVEEHLRHCSDCEEFLGVLAAEFAAAQDISVDRLMAHVESSVLDDLVFKPEALSSETKEWVQAHLQACASCREAFEVLAALKPQLEVGLDQGAERRRGTGAATHRESSIRSLPGWLVSFLAPRRPAWAAATAAAVMLLILGLPAYRGIVVVPRLAEETGRLRQQEQELRADVQEQAREAQRAFERQIDDLRRSSFSSGVAEVNYLQQPIRGSEPRSPRIRVPAGQSTVLLAPRIGLPEDHVGQGDYRFQILAGERIVWSTDVSAPDVARYVHANEEAVVLLVPSSILAPGKYLLRVTRTGERSAEPMFQRVFEISR